MTGSGGARRVEFSEEKGTLKSVEVQADIKRKEKEGMMERAESTKRYTPPRRRAHEGDLEGEASPPDTQV